MRILSGYYKIFWSIFFGICSIIVAHSTYVSVKYADIRLTYVLLIVSYLAMIVLCVRKLIKNSNMMLPYAAIFQCLALGSSDIGLRVIKGLSADIDGVPYFIKFYIDKRWEILWWCIFVIALISSYYLSSYFRKIRGINKSKQEIGKSFIYGILGGTVGTAISQYINYLPNIDLELYCIVESVLMLLMFFGFQTIAIMCFEVYCTNKTGMYKE